MRDPPCLLRPPRQDGWRGHAPLTGLPSLRLERVSAAGLGLLGAAACACPHCVLPQVKAPGVSEAVTLVQLQHHFQCFFLETPL